MSLKQLIYPLIFAGIFSALLSSCAEQKPKMVVELTEEEKALESFKKASAEKIFAYVPSPVEIALILKDAGAKYDFSILNPIENKDRYATIKSKALNLGIYGADLSYVAVFDKSQEAMLYLTATKKLADDLGITNAFDEEKVSRIEENLNNRDSLLILIADTYWESEEYLKENERQSVSAYMIAGGWIEGLYLGTQIEHNLRKSEANKEFMQRLAEQKTSLESLIELLEAYNLDDPDMILNLKSLYELFEAIPVASNDNKVHVTSNADAAPVNGKYKVTEDHMNKINSKVTEIRAKSIF
jgi:hypothetical protein